MKRWESAGLAGVLCYAGAAFAHPMGNFSINHYSKLEIRPDAVVVRYAVDVAEIPTFQEMREFGFGAEPGSAGLAGYLEGQQERLRKGLVLTRGHEVIALTGVSRHVEFAAGAGGLQTMRLNFVFRGFVHNASGPGQLHYQDGNYPGRAGWKEVVVTGDGVRIRTSTAPSKSRSEGLTNYASDLLNNPPEQLSAEVTYERVAMPERPKVVAAPVTRKEAPLKEEAAASAPAVIASKPVVPKTVVLKTVLAAQISAASSFTPRNRFTEIMSASGTFSMWALLSAALLAAGLGALHALEPGHGKTIVAAYLVGSRGTAWHAVLLGLVVTASHMVGVYLLGLATLYASRYLVPEQMYPWLGALSGLSVAGVGTLLFLRHWTGDSGEHSHEAGGRHAHWFSPASGAQRVKQDAQAMSLRELFVLGVTGGIVPCPAALVVLLSAFSLHRIGFGLFLITAFSVGLASVLVVVGLGMVYAKRAMASRLESGSGLVRVLPFVSSALMVVLGVGIALPALNSARGWPSVWQAMPGANQMVPFVSVVLLGLFLGMRHSTDPDHVVAVSTIVSRQGSIRSSAAIGLLWGLGHTLTIFLVGSAIILFGVVIPPRLGLSMEFCVAFMLILLGVLNLTGVTKPRGKAVMAGPPGPGTDVFEDDTRSTSRWARVRAETLGKLGLYQTLRPLVVGLVHGLAGSAAVALLVLSTIKSPLWATLYLLVFGFGTMAGMMLMTTAMSMPLVYSGRRFAWVNPYLVKVSGVASVAFGIFLVYQIGFVDGLFTSQVHWTPQ